MSNSEMEYGGGTSPPARQSPIPADGLHDAICYAVVDWGDVCDEYEGVTKGILSAVRFFFEFDEKMADGRPFVLSTYPIKIKYGRKSSYRALLEDWLGAKDCPESLVGYPLGTLKGRPASINVVHKRRDDGTYQARIGKVMKARAGAPPLVVFNTKLPPWVPEAKKKDNEGAQAWEAQQAARANDAVDDPRPAEGGGFDEVPFAPFGFPEI